MMGTTPTPSTECRGDRRNISNPASGSEQWSGMVSPASANPLMYQPVAVHLVEVSAWLGEYAFGMYRDTIMHEAQSMCDMLALCAYCSWITPVPAMFHAHGDDLAAARLLDAAGLISLRCVSSLSFGGWPVPHDIATGAIDQRTSELAEYPLLPSLAKGSRRDAVAIRRLIYDSVQTNRVTPAADGGNNPAWVLRAVAALAGGKWVQVAESALRGGKEA